MKISLKVNGTPVTDDVQPGEILVSYLRDTLELTGAKVGCDTGQCGACTVKVDGMLVKSCLFLAVQADGGTVDTIEGLAPDGQLTRLQQALHDEHGTQCGFCSPGMVMALSDLLESNPEPSEPQVRAWISGNLCRCTGYQSIVRGALRASRASVAGPGTGSEGNENG